MECINCKAQLSPMDTKCYVCGFSYSDYNKALIRDGY